MSVAGIIAAAGGVLFIAVAGTILYRRRMASRGSSSSRSAGGVDERAIELQIEVVEPGKVARFTQLRRAPVSIGRDPENDLVLEDGSASRRHARIVAGDTGLAIEDNFSTHGTWVDGRRVEHAAIFLGSEIRIGETVIRIV